MFILVPAWPRDSYAPPLTATLLGINLLVFLITWPIEARHGAVVDADRYHHQAHQLAKLVLQPENPLKLEDRALLIAEQAKPDFPSAAVLDLFRKIDEDHFALANAPRYVWDQDYPLFKGLARSYTLKPDATTPLHLFGWNPQHGWFPGLFTHMFLHSSWLHLLFNLLFLWTVGLVIEPVLGGHTLSLYIAGGLAAALAQAMRPLPITDVMVGSSGAIAAMMGFALVAMPRYPITLFYAYMFSLRPRGGTFESALWICTTLWILQQLLFLLMAPTQGSLANVGFAAHVGGFFFGTGLGLIYLLRPHPHVP